MSRQALEQASGADQLSSWVADLAAGASVELGRIDMPELDDARGLLGPGRRVHVSHLPRQTWGQTFELAAQVMRAGFDPVPHVPVRLIESERELDIVLRALRDAGAHELLLISGDYPTPRGPFAEVLSVLQSGRLHAHGYGRISFAARRSSRLAWPRNKVWK